jgi:hypothetical protein
MKIEKESEGERILRRGRKLRHHNSTSIQILVDKTRRILSKKNIIL